jgi:hypothetical protein
MSVRQLLRNVKHATYCQGEILTEGVTLKTYNDVITGLRCLDIGLAIVS